MIKKIGFEKEFIINDINVRDENPYLPVPRIRKTAKDESWYSEDLILGTPINRLKDPSRVQAAIRSVTLPLFKLFTKTAEEIETKKYVEDINRRVEEQIRKNKLLQISEREDLQKGIERLFKVVETMIQKGPRKIFLCQTHGDFQPANILVDDRQTWLIDWEYTGIRQIAYDGLVFALKSRFPQGLSNRIMRGITGDLPECQRVLAEWPHVEWQNKSERHRILALFLIEELDHKMREISNPMFMSLDQGFRTFCEEMKRGIPFLQRTSW